MMKRLVVCCDGTWNDDDRQSEDTNVSRLARAVHGSQNTDAPQIVLYLRGVGTTGLKVEMLVEGATGFGIDDGIRSAYQFIAQNYVPGDEIYLFGFSRGAFSVRSLAGMIGACGILKRQSLGHLREAWDYYRTDKPHVPATFAHQSGADIHDDARVTFLGVWDTVGSLGVPGTLLTDWNAKAFGFHDTDPSSVVKRAVQALAIDEHRRNFVPAFWTGDTPEDTEIEQVWFAGAHADVGGGYKTRTLANIPLVWMAKQAEKSGLKFDWPCLPDPTTLDALAPTHNSSSGLFAFDRYHPVLREIGSRHCDVAINETLYVPKDKNGVALKPINERIHRSVVERLGKRAGICTKEDDGSCDLSVYEPKTLMPFFAGEKFEGLPIAE